MTDRLADRFRAARRRLFVGRTAERDHFRATITADRLPVQVFYIFGPGGVGKTSLLHEFEHMCDEEDILCVRLDARNIESSPARFASALHTALNLPDDEPPLNALESSAERCVICLDTYEKFGGLDTWLQEQFLPQLPPNVCVVLAGREPPPVAWRTDPGWRSVVRIVPLRNLTPDESRDYLQKRSVPEDQHQTVLQFTRGHPLALSLVADLFDQRPTLTFEPADAPDVIKVLVERLEQQVPGPAHRVAMEACALVRIITEDVLAAMLDMPQGHDPHELFDWLRGLSFIEAGPAGLFPHDLAREALIADLRWRNPDWYEELHQRARAYYSRRVQETTGQEQQATLINYVYLHRDNPVVRPFFSELQSQEGAGSVVIDSARDDDWSTLLEMVERHEGGDSAALAEQWFDTQPEGVRVFRLASGEPGGFLHTLTLHDTDVDLREQDPAAQAAWHYLENNAPLRAGETAIYFRFWMAGNTYQSISSVQSHIFVDMVRQYLTRSHLAYSFLPVAQPDFWAPILGYADLHRLPDAGFTIGGREYGVFGHDWRVTPITAWLDLLAEREVSMSPQISEEPASQESLLVLSRPEFAEAVEEALEHYSHPETLQKTPLLRSRLVLDKAGADVDLEERREILFSLIDDVCVQIEQTPRNVKFYRALYHTYLHPAPTQKKAAELVDVPYSTFRRHLQRGVEQVVERLWQKEIGAAPEPE